MSEFFDKTLHYFGRAGITPNIVVIGAMDGHSFDDMAGYTAMYRWSGLYVEPIPAQFTALKAYHNSLPYAHTCEYENCAITETNGEVEILTIDLAAIEAGLLHPCFGGMSAIYPPRNGLGSEGDAESVRKYGRRMMVPCKTLRTVLDAHTINHIDVIQVDAEGWDWKILKQLDLRRYRPKLIRSEYINLTPDEQREIIDAFTSFGYLYTVGNDIDFVDPYWWQLIRSAQ